MESLPMYMSGIPPSTRKVCSRSFLFMSKIFIRLEGGSHLTSELGSKPLKAGILRRAAPVVFFILPAHCRRQEIYPIGEILFPALESPMIFSEMGKPPLRQRYVAIIKVKAVDFQNRSIPMPLAAISGSGMMRTAIYSLK